jgi:tripartite-type tricarboxylate transporter receptor subunit TctC
MQSDSSTAAMPHRRAALQWLAALAVIPPVWAQNSGRAPSAWPQRSTQLIVPFPAGGSSAILAKQVSQAFERVTQQPLRLLFQGGAGGLQGASFAAKAPANGETLLIGGSHLAVARALANNDEFDLMEDLRPLALVALVPQVLVINPQRMRARTVMEWLSDLGRKSARYRMATAGAGSASHIDAEMLRLQEGLRYEFVHFRGSGPALQDLLSGSVDMMIDGLISSLPHIRSGRLKALMVTGRERVDILPDVPCAQEMGVQVLDSVTWYGLFAPIQLSNTQAAGMQTVLQTMGKDEVLAHNLEAMGVRWGHLYGQAFADMVKQETLDWAQRVKRVGLKNLWNPNAEES